MITRRKSMLIYLILTAILFIMFPAQASAQNRPADSVRVGYYENEIFEEGAAPGVVKTGYAYEYYRKLSEYTGWNYEYVYGGFGELYDMLLSGDIDLLAGLAKREDRIDKIGYPEIPMGNEAYILLKHEADDSITSVVSSFSGKKIGVLKSAILDTLEDYLKEHSTEAELVCFDDYESMYSAFDGKEVDIIAVEEDGARDREHTEVICTFGTSDYYLCVSISRPDLLDELDIAQSLMAVEEPNYTGSLQSKYYASGIMSRSFSASEREWLDQNKSVTIGYLNNYLPYSSTDTDGKVTGLIKDLVPDMFKELHLSDIRFDYKGYENYDDMIADIRADKIDAAFPVGGGLYYSEENGIHLSSVVATASTDLVYKGEYDNEDALSFAVNENNRMQYYYIDTYFPDAELIMYPDIDSCLMAVLKEEVGATTLNGLRANEIMKNRRYDGLYLQQLDQTDDRCFGVKIGNEGLLKLINRGIKLLDSNYSREHAYHYSSQLYTYTFLDMVEDNLWLFLIMSLLIALIIIVFIVRDLKRTRLSDRLKTDFVSNMSHEIRTPITAILGMNELIQRESREENILQYADNIKKAGESLLGIINDILDFSRIETGRMELIEQPYSLPGLLGDLNLMIVKRAQDKGLGFIMEVDDRLPVKPIGDMQKLRQVITNLLTNAVKYTEEGQVKLSVRLKERTPEGFEMEVSVEDTGIGIKDEEMDKLYSAFDRLDMERNRNIEGSGLGLSITKRLLEIMGSGIDVKSVYGEGSCFSFCVKQKIADATPTGAFEARDPDADKHRFTGATFTAPEARIMVVDDTPMNLKVICGLLKTNELVIDTAESGEECIELFGRETYDLIFLDHRMPVMDGLETFLELKKRYPETLQRTPVICLTANALSDVREQMLNAGFDDFLSKPVTLFDLEQMLLKHLPEEKIQRSGDEALNPSDEVILRRLRMMGELDVDKGIEYCGDSEEYLDAVNIYRHSAEGHLNELTKLFEASEWQQLSIELHSLKSTSLAIGANGLSALASSLETAAKNEDTQALKNGMQEFLSRYEALGRQLNSLG